MNTVPEWSPVPLPKRPSPFYVLQSVAFEREPMPCLRTQDERSPNMDRSPKTERSPKTDRMDASKLENSVGENSIDSIKNDEEIIMQLIKRRDAMIAENAKLERQTEHSRARIVREVEARTAFQSQTHELTEKARCLGAELRRELAHIYSQQQHMRKLRSDQVERWSLQKHTTAQGESHAGSKAPRKHRPSKGQDGEIPSRSQTETHDSTRAAEKLTELGSSESYQLPLEDGGDRLQDSKVLESATASQVPSLVLGGPEAPASADISNTPKTHCDPDVRLSTSAFAECDSLGSTLGEVEESQKSQELPHEPHKPQEPQNPQVLQKPHEPPKPRDSQEVEEAHQMQVVQELELETVVDEHDPTASIPIGVSDATMDDLDLEDNEDEADIELLHCNSIALARLRHATGTEALVDLRAGLFFSWSLADGRSTANGSVPALWIRPVVHGSVPPWRLTLMEDTNNEPSVLLQCGGDDHASWRIQRTLTVGRTWLNEDVLFENPSGEDVSFVVDVEAYCAVVQGFPEEEFSQQESTPRAKLLFRELNNAGAWPLSAVLPPGGCWSASQHWAVEEANDARSTTP